MRISGFIVVIDSYLLRKGLLAILNRIHGVRVLKEFGEGDPFSAYLKSHKVDYMIMGKAEFDRSAELFISNPELLEKTILVYGEHDMGISTSHTQHDVHRVIGLQDEKESIVRKIQNLLDPGDQKVREDLRVQLSPRETTIVRMVSMGLTNRQIADKLFLSAHTVMTHRKNISSKLGIKSVSGLTVYAIVNNIITIEEVSSLPPK
jgi:DNA-binding NarL/FixJ family response regulator